MAGHKKWSEIKHKRDKKEKPKVLIFGGGGWLAQKLYAGLKDKGFLTYLALSSIDITDPDSVKGAIEETRPEIIINAAGKTGRPNIDWCETHKEETWQSNVLGPNVLAEACRERNIMMAHLSSGCIFDGSSPDQNGFTEEDVPNPVSYYGETKIEAEKVLKEFQTLILRLRMPVDNSPNLRNLITKLAGYSKVIDVLNSVTVVDDLILATARLMHLGRTGIYHVVNPRPIRHKDILSWYREIVDPSHSYELIQPEELLSQGLAKASRSNCILSTAKLIKDRIYLPDAEWAVKYCLRKYAKEWPAYKASLENRRY